jgi:hypothetical protein
MVVGEGLRLLRLIRRENGPSSIPMEVAEKQPPDPQWKSAFQGESVKWGVVVTMIAFVITLRDRVAEVLLVTSFLAGLLLNAPFFRNSQGIEGSAYGGGWIWFHPCAQDYAKDRVPSSCARRKGSTRPKEGRVGLPDYRPAPVPASRPRRFSMGSILGVAPRHFS